MEWDGMERALPGREEVRAMLAQALATAEGKGATRVTRLHVELFDPSPEVGRVLRDLVAALAAGTPAQEADVVTFLAPSRFICWNCCGLRFQGIGEEAICPNCGELGLLIPVDVTFALDEVDCV